MVESYVFGFWSWEEIINWYLTLPAYGQVLCLLAAFAIIALVVAIVYYVVKGVAYLVYYVVKGVVYLVAGIFYGIYKVFEALYYLITGKEKSKKEEKVVPIQVDEVVQVEEAIQKVELTVQYCSECGSQITDTINQQLAAIGIAYCAHCGKGYKSGFIEIES
jgi:hypothetical protein